MPRHRKQGRPGRRAQRQGTWPSRGVLAPAAAIPEAASPATVTSRKGGRPRSRRGTGSGRGTGGLIGTPWSAVGAGLVIVASLVLASPRAVLTFPPGKGGICGATGCGTAGHAAAHGPLSASRWDVKLRPVRAEPARRHPSRPAAHRPPVPAPGPVQLEYALLPRYGSHFEAVILIKSSTALGAWTLRFALPGAQIKLIIAARWTPDGPDGGVASGSAWSSPHSSQNHVRIVILGIGTPRWPSGCVFDRVRCVFRGPTTSAAQPGWGRARSGTS